MHSPGADVMLMITGVGAVWISRIQQGRVTVLPDPRVLADRGDMELPRKAPWTAAIIMILSLCYLIHLSRLFNAFSSSDSRSSGLSLQELWVFWLQTENPASTT